jgi:hypothetical protein
MWADVPAAGGVREPGRATLLLERVQGRSAADRSRYPPLRDLRRGVHGDPVQGDLLQRAMFEQLEAGCGMSEPYTLTPSRKGRDGEGTGPLPFADLSFEREVAALVLVGLARACVGRRGTGGPVPTGALRALRPLARLEALERRTAALESIACLWAAQDPTIPAVATPEPVRELVWSPEQIAWLHHALGRLIGLFRTELSARELAGDEREAHERGPSTLSRQPTA